MFLDICLSFPEKIIPLWIKVYEQSQITAIASETKLQKHQPTTIKIAGRKWIISFIRYLFKTKMQSDSLKPFNYDNKLTQNIRTVYMRLNNNCDQILPNTLVSSWKLVISSRYGKISYPIQCVSFNSTSSIYDQLTCLLSILVYPSPVNLNQYIISAKKLLQDHNMNWDLFPYKNSSKLAALALVVKSIIVFRAFLRGRWCEYLLTGCRNLW